MRFYFLKLVLNSGFYDGSKKVYETTPSLPYMISIAAKVVITRDFWDPRREVQDSGLNQEILILNTMY
jgi:hypothetical protein